MDSENNFERLKYKGHINLGGHLNKQDYEEFENLLSKISTKNTDIYVHGFNSQKNDDLYMLSLTRGISGNKNIKEICYARMHLSPSSLSYHLKLLETNPDLIVEFVQDNEEIDTFRVLQAIKKKSKD